MADWVLVVDDDSSNLRMASHILSGQQLRVSCLKSGEAALHFLQENKPDLILLDIHMPGMDGYETLQADQEAARGKRQGCDSSRIYCQCCQRGA